MKLSRTLIDAVEAVLPGPGEAGIPARTAHDRVGRWGRTTVRHALAMLARAGRAEFKGYDRHRLYRRTALARAVIPYADLRESDEVSAPAATAEDEPTTDADSSWSEYGARADGNVVPPDEEMVARIMAERGIRYGDVDAADLRREERRPGWSWPRPADSAALTRAVFGDPPPRHVLRR